MNSTTSAAPVETDPVMSPREIADDLGVNLSTVWRWQRLDIYPGFLEMGPARRGQLRSVHEAWKRSRPRRAALTLPSTPAAA